MTYSDSFDEWDEEDEHPASKIARNPLVRALFIIDIVLRCIGLVVAWRAKQRWWFVALLVVNSGGLLPAAYLLRFRRKPDAAEVIASS